MLEFIAWALAVDEADNSPPLAVAVGDGKFDGLFGPVSALDDKAGERVELFELFPDDSSEA